MTAVTLRVAAESAHLYAGALATLAVTHPELAAKFVIEERPPELVVPITGYPLQPSRDLTPKEREQMALDDGRRTLRAIREHMYATGQRRDQRAYWREAQRQHRAMSK